jgi:dienelactone hydrolase
VRRKVCTHHSLSRSPISRAHQIFFQPILKLPEHALVDCASTAHPALFDKPDVDALGACPIQFIAPEEDFTFTPELKEYVLKTVPTLGIDFDYQYFTGVAHGFATRGDDKNPVQKKGLERAKNVAVSWFREYLH